MLYFMSQIYGMESLIDTARPQTVWDLRMSTIKWGSLTLTQQCLVDVLAIDNGVV